jgi:hypothetical protein
MTTTTTTKPVTRLALERRILRTAREHGHMAYKDSGVLVIIGETSAFLRVLGDDDVDLPRDQQMAVVRWLARLVDRGIAARVIWPRDWPELQKMIVTGDWRN